MRQFVIALLLTAFAASASAQVSIPNTFVPNTRIVSADVNLNFSTLGTAALNRNAGTMLGDLTLASGADVLPSVAGGAALGDATFRFSTVFSRAGDFSTTLAVAGVADFATSIRAGSGDVEIIDGTGKIPALSSTYIANLNGSNLTGLVETAITDGTILARLAANEVITGVWSISHAAPSLEWSETGAAGNAGRTRFAADANTYSVQLLNDAGTVGSTPIAIVRSGSAATSVELTAPTVSFSSTTVVNAGSYNSAVAQPGFLAYNSAADNGLSGLVTVDYDTEVYDTAGNFAADTFTAPTTGIYQFCASASISVTAGGGGYGISIVTGGVEYAIAGGDAGDFFAVGNGCIHINLAASATVVVKTFNSDTYNVNGPAGAERGTWFSGRLVP